jgi:cysteine desulfurase / selenocysteine lyase
MDVNSFREEFPHIAEGVVHLNHAGVSGLSYRSVARITDALGRQSRDPADFFPYAMDQSLQCRRRLAALQGIAEANLAFTKNTAHGISIIADGLDWRPGDEVIFADCEYPANSYPWLAQQDRGVVCKIVPTRPDYTISVDDYASAFTSRTRILAVSWVQFGTGFRADLAKLTELAHAHEALIVVDIIQGLGAFPIDLTDLGVDAAATGSQKWLLGPMGVGALYVHPTMLDHLRLVNMGALSVADAGEYHTLAFDPKPTVQRYEEGTPNIFGYCGLNAALEILEEAGAGAISERILSITRYAANVLERRGYIVDSPQDDSMRSGILMFHHPTRSTEDLIEALKSANVNAVQRGKLARFAPHFYTLENDIDRAVAALP